MAAAAVEPSIPYPESPYDADDVAFPCKGCGEILEEGKAFELAGNRWHIDCFRCNTCGTLLDSDANLLLLGDGSLICNNCTYSCSGCGLKIEDLAILTGDQAFCSDCFKCRNCKRKIENLRYARTSQGIFCMDCHEALMARRRKKTGRSAASRSKLSHNVQLDKSLPPPPPPDAAPYQQTESEYGSPYVSPPMDAPSVSKTVKELRQADSGNSLPEEDLSRGAVALNSHSPHEPDDAFKGGLTLPSTTFNGKRGSFMAPRTDVSASAGEEFLIPVAFDPSPHTIQSQLQQEVPKLTEDRPRDYFSRSQSSQSKTSSPHITSQLQGLQRSQQSSSDTLRNKKEGSISGNGSIVASPQVSSDPPKRHFSESSSVSQVPRAGVPVDEKFKLQDAPNTKRMHSSQSSRSERDHTTVLSTDPSDSDPFSTPRRSVEDSPMSDQSPKPPQHPAVFAAALPKRGDSLDRAKMSQGKAIPRKEVNSANIPSSFSDIVNQKPNSASQLAKVNGGKVISAPIESPNSKSIYDTPSLPSQDQKESFVEPRSAPMPPPGSHKSRNESVSTIQSEYLKSTQKSPSLPRYSAGGDFTLDEDMARILGNEGSSSFLKRVSNSVRHGRSYSDKAGRMTKDQWPRSPMMNSLGQEISSPSSASLEGKDEIAWFKNQLRVERQKLIEREKKIAELEAQIASSASISQVNSELREKRSTMVVLDTQKEIVVRELEVLTEHIAAVKANKEPLDMAKMTSTVLRDFAASLEKLRTSFTPQVEELIERRNTLLEEITNLTHLKDKSFAEFEQLSSKNAQLAELNNQLVHQIQNLYKANSGQNSEQTNTQVNGLGIYTHHKDKSIESTSALRNMSTDNSFADSGTTLAAGEAEPVTVLQGPQVVSIRKGQPKKFDWRKGQKVAKGVTKGIKGAFSSAQQSYSRDMQFAETGAYGQQPSGQGPEYGSSLPRQNQEQAKGGFGFFGGGQKATGKNGLYVHPADASTPSLLDASTDLYGSDLEQRAEFEAQSIPAIVKRCIDEVETRGMDAEGIYRKSGGNSQVQQVRDIFERTHPSATAHEISEIISDPDMDIHAVTSGLKQYFRKLPVPLITYDVYDRLLETTQIESRDQKVDAMRDAVRGLPRVHYEVLEYLMRHLDRVVELREENLMTSMNIAVVFAPTIMRPESLTRELGDTKAKNETVTVLVEEVDRIFR